METALVMLQETAERSVKLFGWVQKFTKRGGAHDPGLRMLPGGGFQGQAESRQHPACGGKLQINHLRLPVLRRLRRRSTHKSRWTNSFATGL